ncbi:MAG: 4-hydroxy-4-methyl-2-oxoglutarate aldolase [Candidatus Methanomarinus sp.]|nr:MAG: 4-hydroxy-4-methyl-2-oxoglutarate aldolase [ANME-2 cluster archaeon]KAF5425206.1 4-hydroxy-4-methyl-2-oxoglutarate aldolase [ANME-2 cluster archaeon]
MNRTNVMSASIKPLIENVHIAGSAITVKCVVRNNIMPHQAIYIAEPGDIIVVDARGHLDTSVWGDIQTLACEKRGIAGVVIDGSVRNAQEITKSKIPVFCKGVVPAGPHKGWSDSINIPLQCGGVPINPGDIVVGDDDGVVVIPKNKAEEVLSLAKERIETEKKWIRGIKEGKIILEVIELDKRIKELGIEILDEEYEK